jgi:mono/diheme cytochrome c family protein
MRGGVAALGACAMFIAAVAVANDDWHERESIEKKVENLVRVMPGASNLMIEMGFRYQNLYWAAKQGKWEFAQYQAEEMESLLKTLMITRPKRAKTAEVFLKSGFKDVEPAIKARDPARFEAGFEKMRQACMTCHQQNEHAFVTLPLPKRAYSPVLNMD